MFSSICFHRAVHVDAPSPWHSRVYTFIVSIFSLSLLRFRRFCETRELDRPTDLRAQRSFPSHFSFFCSLSLSFLFTLRAIRVGIFSRGNERNGVVVEATCGRQVKFDLTKYRDERITIAFLTGIGKPVRNVFLSLAYDINTRFEILYAETVFLCILHSADGAINCTYLITSVFFLRKAITFPHTVVVLGEKPSRQESNVTVQFKWNCRTYVVSRNKLHRLSGSL